VRDGSLRAVVEMRHLNVGLVTDPVTPSALPRPHERHLAGARHPPHTTAPCGRSRASAAAARLSWSEEAELLLIRFGDGGGPAGEGGGRATSRAAEQLSESRDVGPSAGRSRALCSAAAGW
jgi:hypothetical protein